MTPSDLSEIDVVARTIWGEARGEGLDGMQAVASVIARRAALAREYMARRKRAHPLYGDGTLRGACLAPSQFSCWNAGDPNRALLLAPISGQTYKHALGIADLVIADRLIDNTGGATHYVTAALHKTLPPTHWAKKMKITARIGGHVFMKET